MRWTLSSRQDPEALPLADRHYNRQKPGTDRFGPPARSLALLAVRTPSRRALWLTSWPFAEYVKHEWAGAWVNSLFRNERAGLSSSLIRDAVAVTRWFWPEVPSLGMVTFVDETKIRPKADPGYCYLQAGFVHVGRTKRDGLLAFQLSPDAMPPPAPPLGATLALFGGPR